MKPNRLRLLMDSIFWGFLALGIAIIYVVSHFPLWICVIIGIGGYCLHGVLMYFGDKLGGKRRQKDDRAASGGGENGGQQPDRRDQL